MERYNVGDFIMAILKPKEMAERLNVTVKTLQIRDKKEL